MPHKRLTQISRNDEGVNENSQTGDKSTLGPLLDTYRASKHCCKVKTDKKCTNK